MNNRYFGNIHDFCKYGLLRLLAEHATLGVCWMLTPEKEGKFGYKYLGEEKRWRGCDPDLFDRLLAWRNTISSRGWGVHLIENPNLIRDARFFGGKEAMPEDGKAREDYFGKMLEEFANQDVIFLDPDYGLVTVPEEIQEGRCNRYLRADEVARCFNEGHSVLFYQHWRQGMENDPVGRVLAEIRAAGIDAPVRVLRPRGVFERGEEYGARARFFLVPQSKHAESIGKFVDEFRKSKFSPRPRIGVFVDLGNYHSLMGGDSHGAIVHALGRIRRHGEIAGWKRAEVAGWVFAQKHLLKVADKLCVENNLTHMSVPYGPEKEDIELTDKVRDVVTHGEADAVVVFAADKDYKMAAGRAAKHGVPYYGIGNENQKNGNYAALCEGFYWVEKTGKGKHATFRLKGGKK